MKANCNKNCDITIELDAEDIKSRDEYRKRQDEMYLVIKGDPTIGIPGYHERLDIMNKDFNNKIDDVRKCQNDMEAKLDNDHELLWWNRKIEDIWKIIKVPIYCIIALGIIAAVLGGNFSNRFIEYIALKLGVK